MAFGRLSGRLGLPPVPPLPARGPNRKQAADTEVGQQLPHDSETSPPVPSPPAFTTIPAAESIELRGRTTPNMLAVVIINTEEVGSADESPPVPLDTTEDDGAANAIRDDTEFGSNESTTVVEEAKREVDEANQGEDIIDLDVFDGDNFMEGLRKERLFSPTARDDVNLVATADISDSESDADDEDVMTDNEVAPALEEDVADVEDLETNDDATDIGNFDLTNDDLRDIAGSGWFAYDEEHSRRSGCYRIIRARQY
ncbi:unnamed protein product [Phytophthora fragariaefolia]|uniref:Unnamed protein product n=1 Tax=Phytophthora fragariaefolia TaxID=1490495 RepID=A0A9W6U7N2_9STRA|nr:unnamed protein product [Phytophthora fragariaefolia]